MWRNWLTKGEKLCQSVNFVGCVSRSIQHMQTVSTCHVLVSISKSFSLSWAWISHVHWKLTCIKMIKTGDKLMTLFTWHSEDDAVVRCCYWHGNGLAIHRSWVWVLAECHCVVAFCKLLLPMCVCHQADCYWPRKVIFLAGKVTLGLVESNGSLPLGLWLMSPVGWLPRNGDQLSAQHS